MYGLVSLLNDPHHGLVERLWMEIAQRFGVENGGDTAVPHFSYHVAENYNVEQLGGILEGAARETAVFTVQAEGIGIFPSEKNVIYIAIARNMALTQLHERLWTAVTPHSQGIIPYYAPANWFPHITLAHGSFTPNNLGPIVTWLHTQRINWTITVDNFTLLSDGNGRRKMRQRFAFSED